MFGNSFFKSGWISDPARVQEVIRQRIEAGHAVMGAAYAAQNAPSLPGSWQRHVDSGGTGVFLRSNEPRVYGSYLRPWFQKAGTCVSRGMQKGVQTSLTVFLTRLGLMNPVHISFAPIYTTARVEIGHNRCGYGDGAILADAAHAVHDIGVATDDLFQNLSEDEVEQLAVKYATPGEHTPDNWLAACKGHTCSTFWPETLIMIADCLAAGYAVPYAHGYVTGMPNANGESPLGAYGPHCRCFTGVYIDVNGVLKFVSSESWGSFPARAPQLSDQTCPIDQLPRIRIRFAGGEFLLGPGDVGVDAKTWFNQIQNGGEAWAVSAPDFSADRIADLVNVNVNSMAV